MLSGFRVNRFLSKHGTSRLKLAAHGPSEMDELGWVEGQNGIA